MYIESQSDAVPLSYVRLFHETRRSLPIRSTRKYFRFWLKLIMSASDGAFSFLKLIGKGAFGSVYLIKDKSDGEKYALKVVDLKKFSSETRTRALMEAEIMKKLDHNHFVQFIASYIEGTNLFIFTEYCVGGDLSHFLRVSEAQLPEELIVCWMWQIASALSHMHGLAILHRDLKPENIYLLKHANLKLGDLGIARVLETNTSLAFTVGGTPCYMSPEMFAKQGYNHKSDIWSFGCIVYELANKKRAYEGVEFLMFLLSIECNYKELSLPDKYSAELKRLVRDMTIRDPDRRSNANDILTSPLIQQYASTKKSPLDIITSSGHETRWRADTLEEGNAKVLPNNFEVKDVKFPVNKKTLRKQPLPELDHAPQPAVIQQQHSDGEMEAFKEFMNVMMDKAQHDKTVNALASRNTTHSEMKEKRLEFLMKQIVALQQHCVRGLGMDMFSIVYSLMSEDKTPMDIKEDLVEIMGEEKYEMCGQKLIFLRMLEMVHTNAESS